MQGNCTEAPNPSEILDLSTGSVPLRTVSPRPCLVVFEVANSMSFAGNAVWIDGVYFRQQPVSGSKSLAPAVLEAEDT